MIGWRPDARITATNIRTRTLPAAKREPSDADDERDADRQAGAADDPTGRSRSSTITASAVGVGSAGFAAATAAAGRPAALARPVLAAASSAWSASASAHGAEERAAPPVLAPEVRGPRVEPAADADAAPRPGEPVATSASHERGPSSALTGSTRQPPQARV